MRRTAFDAIEGFDVSISVFEDTEFYLRLMRSYRVAAVPDPLVYKRVHGGAVTAKRNTLMRHHANVALHFSADEPRLLPYVGKRLGERARKLGNLELKDGHIEKAMNFYCLALSLDPFNITARIFKLLLKFGGQRGVNALISPWSKHASYGKHI